MKRERKFRLGIRLMSVNFKTLLLFELFYKLIATALFTPLLIGMFNLSMHFAGLSYVSNANLFYFVLRPSTIIMALFMLVLLILFTMIEMGAIIHCYHAAYYNQKVTVIQMMQAGLRNALKIFRGNNWLIIIYVLVILPLTNFALVSGYVSSITIPDFILDYIDNNTALSILFYGLLFLFTVIAMRWITSLHSFTLEAMDFNQARKESLRMNKKRYLRNVIGLLVWNLMIALFIILCAVLGIIALAMIVKTFSNGKIALSIVLALTTVIIIIFLIIYANFTLPISVGYISADYYKEKERLGEEIPAFQPMETKHPKIRKYAAGVVLAAALVNFIYASIFTGDDFSWNVQLLEKPEISAHRGDSVTAPENTIPAFENAIEHHADYAELDVQQTKDGVIVVMHDSNIKRISGINKNVWDMTYDELKDIDIGSWFGRGFANVRVATLDEVLKLCKGQIKLNIELKPTGHETDFEKSVVDIVYANGYENDCVIASMKYACLERVKEYAPELTCVYVMAVAYGAISHLECADIFSVESSFITSKMVNTLHEEGKKIYAWTVNDEDTVRDMYDLGVDNIITDNPVMARNVIYSNSLNEDIVEYIYKLLGMK